MEKTPVDKLKFTIFVVADVIVSGVLFFMEMEYKAQFIYILFCCKFILLLCFYASMLLCFYASMLLCFYASMLLCFYASMLPRTCDALRSCIFSLAVLDVCSIMFAGAFSVFSVVMYRL